MKWLVLSSAVLSCLSNMFSMIGYECIALAGENYKLRRRCIRFGGFLIFLSGNGSPSKNPDIKTPLVASFFIAVVTHFSPLAAF